MDPIATSHDNHGFHKEEATLQREEDYNPHTEKAPAYTPVDVHQAGSAPLYPALPPIGHTPLEQQPATSPSKPPMIEPSAPPGTSAPYMVPNIMGNIAPYMPPTAGASGQGHQSHTIELQPAATGAFGSHEFKIKFSVNK